MTVCEAVGQADELSPNKIDNALKRRWLAEADGLIRERCVRFSAAGFSFEGVGADGDVSGALPEEDEELLVPEPFAGSVYRHYLIAQIDLALGETGRYQNEMQAYNDALEEFAAHLRRRYPAAARARFRY